MKALLDYCILLIIFTLTNNQFDLINCLQKKSNEVGPDNPPLKEAHCSRKHSKFIREYFARVNYKSFKAFFFHYKILSCDVKHQALLPIFHKYNLPVPEKCPFSPMHDIYHLHENNKTKVDVYNWKCEICGKHFSSETFLDKHFENKHKDSLQKVPSFQCFLSFIFYYLTILNIAKLSISTVFALPTIAAYSAVTY